jgi:hypothetical protein
MSDLSLLQHSERKWHYSDGKAVAYSVHPEAMYMVTEIIRKRKNPLFSCAVLTGEWGWIDIGPDFRTLLAAQRFCEADVDNWS